MAPLTTLTCVASSRWVRDLDTSHPEFHRLTPPFTNAIHRQLQKLQLQFTGNISGTIPACISNLTQLKTISLHSNQLRYRLERLGGVGAERVWDCRALYSRGQP